MHAVRPAWRGATARWRGGLGAWPSSAAAARRRGSKRWFCLYTTPTEQPGTAVVEHHVKVAPWIARLRPAWDLLRQNRSKVLTKEQFLAECPRALPEIVDGLFAIFDMHPRNGEISYDEMCAYVLIAGDRGTAEEKIESLFPICDVDGDNKITCEELYTAVKMLYWARFKDVEYVAFKVDKIMHEVRAHTAGLEAAEHTEEPDIPARMLPPGEREADATCQALARRPVFAASQEANAKEGASGDRDDSRPPADLVEAAAEGEVHSPSASEDGPVALTLRRFTEWARSDCKHVSELRELLRQPFPASAEAGEDEDDFETFSMQANMAFERIKVDHPVVELDGDEMTRIMWDQIKQKLIFPFLDMQFDYYDLSITFRDDTADDITNQAIDAIQKHKVGIKCPTIAPDMARVMEFNLGNPLKEPNSAIQNVLDGTMFQVPVVLKNIPRYVPGWSKPIVIGRPAHGDQAVQLTSHADRPGTFKLVYEPDDGERQEETVCTFTHRSEGGVMMGMRNTRKSVKDFAKCCFEYALNQGMPLYLSTNNNVLEVYDGLFSDEFDKMYQSTYKKAFEDKGLWYQHRVVDDMVSQVMKSNGGFVWACKSSDGDAMSGIVGQGYGSLGLMTSVLMTPDGQTVLTQAGHGTVTRHFRAFQRGEKTSTNPIASIFAWTRGLAHRARLDHNERLLQFTLAVEEACVNCVQGGQMSRDLAVCVHGDQVAPDHWLATEDLLNAIANELRIVLGKGLRSETTAQEVPFQDPAASGEHDSAASSAG